MSRLGQIRKQLKHAKKWNDYKKMYAHPQMRLLFSKIALTLNPELDNDFLATNEISLIDVKKNKTMFVKTLKKLEGKFEFSCDWEKFALFIWYVFQTSTYWKDSKKHVDNIFTRDNYLEVNEQKREAYQAWIDSVDKKHKDFNNFIIEISRLVF